MTFPINDEHDDSSSTLEDLLGVEREAQAEAAPPPQAPPQAPPAPEPPRRQGGLAPAIARKRAEVLALEKKIREHRTTGAYSKKHEDGSEYFDFVSMQEDTANLGIITRELAELKDRDRELSTNQQQRSQRVTRLAKEFLDSEIPRLPEPMRKGAREMFVKIFGQALDNGTFSDQKYADRAKVVEVLGQILDAAYGHVARSGGASQTRPPDGGFDEKNESRRPPPTDEDEDDFTNNLMYAYTRSKGGSLTVAEAKRLQREAQKGSGQ